MCAGLGMALLALAFFLVSSAFADPPPTLVVNTAADSTDSGSCTDVCSLRDAITVANASGGATIDFAIGGGSVTTIHLTQPLPPITVPVTIDGTTQPLIGLSPFGIAIDGGAVTDLVHGQVTSDGVRGLVLAAGSDGSTIRGLALGNFDDLAGARSRDRGRLEPQPHRRRLLRRHGRRYDGGTEPGRDRHQR